MTRSRKKSAEPPRAKARRAKSAAAIARSSLEPVASLPFIVDAHAHTFNASDLSKLGFVTEVLLDSDERIIRKLIEPFATSLVRLIQRAPGYTEELEHLEGISAAASMRARTALVQAHGDRRAARDEEHWENVAGELRRLSISTNGRERALFQAIVDEVHPGGLRALALADDLAATPAIAQRIALSSGPFARYIKWIGRLRHFRADIISEMLQTYGSEPDGVTLFAAALVDFEFWLKDKPETPFPQQIELGARLAGAFPGRIHFFAPFDPWREIAHGSDSDSSLTMVKAAVGQDGFLGVKLYPPMGFAASGNARLDFSAVGVNDPQFGARIDQALDSLFAWAVADDVPIMAHCNLSQESKHGYAGRASPAFWAEALSRHHGLRLNLAHFGGQPNLGPAGATEAAGWPEAIIGLMETQEGARLYTDIGKFDMDDETWFEKLKTALEEHQVLLSRLMYGSDWMMLATDNHYEDFLSGFRKGLRDMSGLDEVQVAAILGGNARDFLGLNPGDKTRARLEAFYQRSKTPLPPWLQ